MIEVWEHVLYVRMKKGRNTFFPKPDGLTAETGTIFINLNLGAHNAKRLISKYHPDRSKSKNANTISAILIQWYKLLTELSNRNTATSSSSILDQLRQEFIKGKTTYAGIHITLKTPDRHSNRPNTSKGTNDNTKTNSSSTSQKNSNPF